MAFEPFDLARIVQSAEALKSMRSNAATEELQRQYLGQRMQNEQAAEGRAVAQESRAAAQEGRVANAYSQEQQITNTKLLNMAATEVADNPAAAARWDPIIKAAIPGWESVKGDPAQIQASAAKLRDSTTKALQAYQRTATGNNVQSTQILDNGNLGIVTRDGRVIDTGQAAKPQISVQTIDQVPTVVSATGTGVKTTPLSTQDAGNTAANARAAAEAGGKATGTGQAERALDLPAAKARLSRSVGNFDRLATSARDLLANQNLWKAVGLGKGLALIPGSAGADVQAAVENLQSQAGLSVLQDMRDNSKTGGAVGNVSNFEQQIFQNYISALGNLNQSPESFKRQLEKLVDFAEESKARFNAAFEDTYPELKQSQAGGGRFKVEVIN